MGVRVGPLSLIVIGLLGVETLRCQVSVWTHHYDNARTGENLSETQLTTSTVNVTRFGKLWSYTVDASVYAQPLYLPNVTIPGKGTHNVLYVATMNDSIYAFDADSNLPPLWFVNLTNPAAGITAVPADSLVQPKDPNFEGTIGIVGTPVIDQSSGTMYLVARTKENGQYFQRLHALDVTTGAEKFGGPVVVQPSVPGTGYDAVGGRINFNPLRQNQRAGLALANGKVYVCWGSLDDYDPFHGWVVSYDAATLQQVAAFVTTPDGGEGGIWQSGQPPSIDASGNLYLGDGNGDYDGVRNFGSSILKLSPALSLLDWFTPDNFSFLNANDLDLGVSGLLLIPNTSLVLTGSKTGQMFLLQQNSLGHEQAGNGQIVQAVGGLAGHVHGAPVYWNSPTRGPLVYVWTENDFLKAFHFNGTTFDTSPVMLSSFRAATGMPGGILSVSANGSAAGTGILWSSMPLVGDAEKAVVPGILRAFDANNLATELWNSTMNSSRDDVGNFAKFCPPVVVNGRVYLPTFSNRVHVYGLISTAPDFAVSATPATQTVAPGGGATYAVSVSAISGFTGTVSLAVSGLPAGATGTFTPPTISGAGSANLAIATSGSNPAGSYALTITGTSGSLSHSYGVTLGVSSTASGNLSGSLSLPSTTQNLTALGTADWAHWGLTTATTYNHKSGVTAQISNYSMVAGTAIQYSDHPFGFSWTDGTPTATATATRTGVYSEGLGSGFRITAPADMTQRSLTVFAGVWSAQGKLVAHLSDGSAPDYVDTSLSNASGTQAGMYTLTYSAATAGQTLTVTFVQNTNTAGNVTLQAAALKLSSSDFTLGAAPATQSINPGANATYTVTIGAQNGFGGTVALSATGLPSGATAAFSPASVTGSGTSTLTVSSSGTTPAGSSPITITGTSGTLTHTAGVTLTVTAPDFTIAAAPGTQTINPGANATYTVTIGAQNGFGGAVALSATGLPSGATAAFSPASVTGSGTSTLTITSSGTTPPGSSPITITGTSGTLTHTAVVTLTLTVVVADFTIASNPTSRTVTLGGSTTYTITVSPTNGFAGNLTLSVSGLPTGATGTFNPTSIAGGSGSSTLTVTTTGATPVGSSTLVVQASSGSLSHTVSVTLRCRRR
jgi:hypothetical protein